MFAKVIKALFVVLLLALVGMAAQNEMIRNRLIDVVLGLPKAPMIAFGFLGILFFSLYKGDQKEEKRMREIRLLIGEAERKAAAFRAARKKKETPDLDNSLVSEDD